MKIVTMETGTELLSAFPSKITVEDPTMHTHMKMGGP